MLQIPEAACVVLWNAAPARQLEDRKAVCCEAGPKKGKALRQAQAVMEAALLLGSPGLAPLWRLRHWW